MDCTNRGEQCTNQEGGYYSKRLAVTVDDVQRIGHIRKWSNDGVAVQARRRVLVFMVGKDGLEWWARQGVCGRFWVVGESCIRL